MESKFKVGDTVYFMRKNIICRSKVNDVEIFEDTYMYGMEICEGDRFEESLLHSSLDGIIGHLVQHICT